MIHSDIAAFIDNIETKQSLVDFRQTKFVSIGKPNKKRRRAIFIAFGSLSVFFLFGSIMVLPLFNGRNGLDVLSDMVGGDSFSVDTLGDEPPVDNPAYDYEYFVAPSNSFGMGDTVFKTVNWSHFKNLFKNNFQYDLEYRIGSGDWVSAKQYLNIGLDWQDDGYWKINLTFTKPPSPEMDVRFTVGMNKQVLNYVEPDSDSPYCYYLNYSANDTEVYNCYFNFSDLMGIPGLVFNHGVSDNLFWFRFRKDDVPQNDIEKVYVFDPTFGYTTEGTGQFTIEDAIYGGLYTTGSEYSKLQLDSITAYMNCGGTCNKKAAVYDSSGNFVGETEETSIGSGIAWRTLNFVGTKPILNPSTNYYIVVMSDGDASYHIIRCNTGGNNVRYKAVGVSYPTYPSTITLSLLGYWTTCIYGTYTEGAGEPPLPPDTPPSIESNFTDAQTTGIGLNCSNFWFNDSEGDIIHNWMNASNGQQWSINSSNVTGYIVFSGLDYSSQYWVNCTSFDSHNQTWFNISFNTTSAPSEWQQLVEWNLTISNSSGFNQLSEWNLTISNLSNNWVQQKIWNLTISNQSIYQQLSEWNLTLSNTSIPDSTIPLITINFAGNLSDSGGPYWRPPGESVTLSGDFSDGYYTNDSCQSEDWIYLNLSISEPESDIDDLWLNWLNGTTWTNWTYSFANMTGGYWEYNTSGNIETYEGYDYSFDIVANNTDGGVNWTAWNKTVDGGGYWRRTVQLNCTPTDITYTPYYTYRPSYTSTNKHDILHHDQGVDGTTEDSGYLLDDLPTDTVETTYCVSFTGNFFDESVCVQPFILDNIYLHIWWSAGYATWLDMGWNFTREYTDLDSFDDYVHVYKADNKSEIYYDGPAQDNFWLNTNILDVDDTLITDNNVYEIDFRTLNAGDDPVILSNRSFTSFVLFNVPSNETLNSSYPDSDSDLLSDYNELWTYYTNPFLVDTDNDGVSDYDEIMSGSDPNNYTNTIPYSPPVDEWQQLVEWNLTLSNTSAYQQQVEWNLTISNQSSFQQMQEWNLTLSNLTNNWYQQIEWNLTISNLSSSFSQISEWNLTISNSSSFQQLSEWNVTISNLSNDWYQKNIWNLTLVNNSGWFLLQNWNLTISNNSNWLQINNWNVTISNLSNNWVQQKIWNLTISNTSNFQQLNEWNLTISNQSIYSQLQEWNLTLSNTSIYQQLNEWTLTISNQSSFQQLNEWNLTISNTSNAWNQQIEWNLTINNQSIYSLLNEWNLTISNLTNNPPVITVISPVNNSIDVSITIGAMNITIEDPEGDKFSYHWACSDGSYNSASGNTNGTKLLMIDTGPLDYCREYTWWVNATDSKGAWTNNTYNFTTVCPTWNLINTWNLTISNLSNNWYQTSEWNLTISNLTGGNWQTLITWNLTISNQSIYLLLQEWNLTISNTTNWTISNTWNLTISNTTPLINIIITNEHPTNQSNIPTIIPSIYFTIEAFDGSAMNYTIYWGENTDNLTSNISYGESILNGTYYDSFTNVTDYGQTYYWSVNATDGTIWVNHTYHFRTRHESMFFPIGKDNFTLGLMIGGTLIPVIVLLVLRRRKKKLIK